jgi:putative ABC transport system permease protein
MTIVAVALCLVAFLLIRTVSAVWTDQVRQTPDNRVVTRHKMGWMGTLPIHYVQSVREMQGVRQAVGVSWGMLMLPLDRQVEFDSNAVEAKPFIDMHYELNAPAEEKQAFIEDRQGALVSVELAKEFGWHRGDVVHFRGTGFAGELALNISGIFESSRRGFARRSVYFHWEYVNEVIPAAERDRVNIIAAEITDPFQGARIAQAIDIAFDRGDSQTFSQQDQAVNAQLVGEFGAILSALDFVSVLILGIITLVLGNTLAMTVRERKKEYGTLRAVGFKPRHVITVILGEATLLGLLGGLLGLFLAFPLIGNVASSYLEKSVHLPPLEISSEQAFLTIAIGAVLGGTAAVIPAWRQTQEEIVDALRSIG